MKPRHTRRQRRLLRGERSTKHLSLSLLGHTAVIVPSKTCGVWTAVIDGSRIGYQSRQKAEVAAFVIAAIRLSASLRAGQPHD